MTEITSPEESLAEGFARQLVQLAAEGSDRALLAQAARAVSLATSGGHVCTDLRRALQMEPQEGVEAARAALLASGLVACAGGKPRLPLVIDEGDRVYLARYFDYEQRLAHALMDRAAGNRTVAEVTARPRLDELFAGNRARLGEQADWQRIACALALGNRLTVIAGGPGTGKTTTLVKLLAILLDLQPDLRISLAAPTGKAAQRMLEALRQRSSELPVDLRVRLPQQVFTVHRLLGVRNDRRGFRHHPGNPLALDLLVVDEASMLDLALATRLMEALPNRAQVIFLGDKDQLAAVEAGALFHEICSDPSLDQACRSSLAQLCGCPLERIQPPSALHPSPLKNCTIWLDGSLRYAPDSGIGLLAADINRGDATSAQARLAAGSYPDLQWNPAPGTRLSPEAMEALAEGFRTYIDAVCAYQGDALPVFAAFDRFRVLCAVRGSERGAERLNQELGARFRANLQHPADDGRSPWYPGRPVMIASNDYALGLFNGDVGLCLPAEDGTLLVYFLLPDSTALVFSPSRLPGHETAFAMTVHKAQGSEFEHLALVLPAHESRVLTRELVYTAVSRARKRLTLYGSGDILARAIALPTERNSGLLDRLEEVARLARAGLAPGQQ